MKVDTNAFRIGVIGAGSWGTALADLLGRKGFSVQLWVHEPEVCEEIRGVRENRPFLPGFTLSERILPTTDLKTAVTDQDMVVLVVPSHVMRETAEKLKPILSSQTVLVTASKGIENRTFQTMTGILQSVLTDHPVSNLAVLSGPSFAREVAQRKPTVVTVAANVEETAVTVQHAFATPEFRVYTSDDMIGVELSGALKNVIAIGAGISDGLELGLNSRAALITRGLNEIRRIGNQIGANPHTFSGLAGVGDLMLTCTGNLSRNYTLGLQVGQGRKVKDILDEMKMVAEGVKTARSIHNWARKLGASVPICDEVYRILHEDAAPSGSVIRLMTRDLKPELDLVQV
ncbi:MAG: glycerol-3-phosphate dehydrogenase [Deltaproteobacteria bacterium]|nr:MAG: glycerol-3-phosphate dehydrogenase [Deltaproteobacteria bacterium]